MGESTRAPYKSGLIRNTKGGYEWKNHKYIDKIKTKNGKIRYIYENKNGDIEVKTADELKRIQIEEENKRYYEKRKRKIENEFDSGNRNLKWSMEDISKGQLNSAGDFINKAVEHYSEGFRLTGEYLGDRFEDLISDGRNWLKDTFGV